MRNNGPMLLLVGMLILFFCGVAGIGVCSMSGRGVATHAIDVYATTEARPLTVGERAAEIREETRLDNNGIPAGFWAIMIFTILIVGGSLVYFFQGEKLLQAKAERDKQQRLLEKGQQPVARQPAPSPYSVIDDPHRPQLPPAPRYPSLPMPPSLQRLEDGNQG